MIFVEDSHLIAVVFFYCSAVGSLSESLWVGDTFTLVCGAAGGMFTFFAGPWGVCGWGYIYVVLQGRGESVAAGTFTLGYSAVGSLWVGGTFTLGCRAVGSQ